MPIIRQGSLFDLQDLYDLEPPHRYEAILSSIDVNSIVYQVGKKSWRGAPLELNYRAMIQSLIIRISEKFPTIKDLIRRLNCDFIFKLDCGFLLSDKTPSEAAYSRLISKLSETNILEEANEKVVEQACDEGFITDDSVAIDATHFEARDQAPSKSDKTEDKEKPKKKRGRKTKDERDQWLNEKSQHEATLPLFKKKIEAQLDAPLKVLHNEVPQQPEWGIKKNSEGKNVFWYGYKGHLAVGTKSQYIIEALFSSGNLNDGKAAIPLLKGIHERLPVSTIQYGIMDAGYDYEAIYEQIHRMGLQSVIAYNKRNEREPEGFDKYFAPTCVREHSYRYDSFDPKYETLKYTRPKECKDCPLSHDDLCQKVYKVKITTDLRKYVAPARGSQAWKLLFKKTNSG